MKKTILTLSTIALCLSFSGAANADYAYCKFFESIDNKENYYFTDVFYTSERKSDNLEVGRGEPGQEFVVEYAVYSSPITPICRISVSKTNIRKLRDEDIQNEGWADVIETGWKPR